MKFFAPFRPFCLASAALLFVGAATAASGGTLTTTSPHFNVPVSASNTYTGATTNVNVGALLLGSSANYGGSYTIFSGLGSETGIKKQKFPALTGKAGDLKITTSDDGNTLKVKTKVAVTNVGTGAAKNVTATVYLSDDAILDDDDTRLATLKLADYVPGATKLRKGQTLSIPIQRKVPTAAAAFLEDKYLIAVLTADTTGGNLVFGNATSTGLVISASPATFPSVATTVPGTVGTIDLTSTRTLADVTLVAQEVITFSVDRPNNKKVSTDAIVPTASFKVAATSEVFNLLPGEEKQAQPGDELRLLPGTYLHMTTEGSWKGDALGLNLGAGTSIPADARLTAGHTTITNPPNVVTAAPSNQVIIGPIRLP